MLPLNYQSYFRLSIPGVGTTGDILFDITSAATLNTTATAIQTALRTLTGDSGLTVAYQRGPGFHHQLLRVPRHLQQWRPCRRPTGHYHVRPGDRQRSGIPAALQSTFTNPNFAGLGLDRQEWEAYLGLLRGDSNAAMFTQFDADPTLNTTTGATTTIVSSDDIANANRDGQNATYYLDLDPYATSGGFDIDLGVPSDSGSGDSVTLTLTPIYYSGGGPVNPDATIGAFQKILASAPNLGVNWPTASYLGPVTVQLVNNPFNPTDKNLSGDFPEELGST